jgi:hypothetical protein
MPDELTYVRAASRIGRSMMVIAAAGTAVALATGGWQGAGGFALGAAISGLNFRWLRKLIDALGGDAPRRRSSVILGFRYLILGIGAYVILRLIPVNLTAVLAGVFVLTAAVFVEVVFEIVYARK